jgi:hypothetical protein
MAIDRFIVLPRLSSTLMMRLAKLVAAAIFAQAAAGQSADDYRGGWRTDAGEPHTYEFSIRGTVVRGIYCTYCADATTLAFVDGRLEADGLRFEVTHVSADGSTGNSWPDWPPKNTSSPR